MAEQEYWFARRFPVGHPRNAMAPVSKRAMEIVWTFVGWMVGGAVAAVVIVLLGLFAVPYLWIAAPFVFAGCAAYGGWYFVSQAMSRGDKTHTVDVYKAGRVPGQKPYMQ
ncbi:MAG: hypothetical protein ACYCZU_06940 [Devosia sp.]